MLDQKRTQKDGFWKMACVRLSLMMNVGYIMKKIENCTSKQNERLQMEMKSRSVIFSFDL